MPWILLAIMLLVVLAVLAALKGKQGTDPFCFPYEPAKALFSPAERSFLGVLEQAIGPEYRVFGKVHVADPAIVKSGLSQSARQSALNRVAAKHIDCVICRASDLAALGAVERNDKTHADPRRQDRDAFVAKVRETHLPLLTIPGKSAYSAIKLRTQCQLLYPSSGKRGPQSDF